MRKYIFAALAFPVIAACSTADTPQFQGYYTWGHEVESFTPCGSTESFWVMGDPAMLQQLREKAATHSQAQGQPYQPIYVEASGAVEPKPSDGFAADYDGVYRFTEVHTVSESAPSDCSAHG